MQKSYYEIDPFNRLVINGTGSGTLKKFRRVLDGKFTVDGNNNLSYHIKAPLSEIENIPHQLKLDGTWSLGDGHKLNFTLDKNQRRTSGGLLTLQGRIIDVDKNSLLFAITTKSGSGQSTYILDLQGSWNADENNQLSLRVKRELGGYDKLTLSGEWEVNKDHQIVYKYESSDLSGKKKQIHSLIFKGFWDIKSKARVSYLLEGDLASAFNFKISAGIFTKDYIKYELGIGIGHKASPIKRTVTLFGRWRLKRNIGLLFEVKYEGKKVKAILFGADVVLIGGGMVLLKLKSNADNKDLGIEFEISKKILEGTGEIFLRALASEHELACYAGAAWRW